MASTYRSARVGLQALLALTWAARLAPASAATTTPTSEYVTASSMDFGENAAGSADAIVFTGAATYRIPVSVPAGRPGVTPNVDLIYNSQNKEQGILGFGWSIPLEAIQRKLDGGVKYDPCELGCEVAYAKGGAAVTLVRTPSGEYRSKIDDGANVRFLYDAATASWTAYDKDGRKYQYGQTAASRQDDPANAARVFKWCLDRVEDSNGNYLTVSYTKDRGQIYPAEIRYAGNENAGLSSPLTPKAALRFALESGNWLTSDLTDFSVTTVFKVAEIQAYVDGALAWKYAFEYMSSSLTRRLLLKKVRRFGQGGARELLPSIDLEWTPGAGFGWGMEDNSYRLETWTGAGSARVTGDFNGDGRADLAHTTEGTWSWTMRLATGSSFDTATWSTLNYPALETGAKTITGDFNGDGRTEIAYSKPGWTSWRVQTWNGTQLDVNDWWTTFPGCTDDTCRAVGYGDGHDFVFVGDFNGDGKTDVARAPRPVARPGRVHLDREGLPGAELARDLRIRHRVD